MLLKYLISRRTISRRLHSSEPSSSFSSSVSGLFRNKNWKSYRSPS